MGVAEAMVFRVRSEPDAKEKIRRAKEYCQRNNISEGDPDLLYLILEEVRSTNFRLTVLLGTSGFLVGMMLSLLLN